MDIFLIFSRWGILCPVIGAAAVFLAISIPAPSGIDHDLWDECSLAAALFLWGVGCFAGCALFDQPRYTEEGTAIRPGTASFMFVPMKAWAYVLIGIAGLIFFTKRERLEQAFRHAVEKTQTQSVAEPVPAKAAQIPFLDWSATEKTEPSTVTTPEPPTPKPPAPRTPSAFDCTKKALGVDYVICASSDLLDAEANLEDAYRAALQLPGGDAPAVKSSQRDWSRRYGVACGLPARGKPSDALISARQGCVLDAIKDRIAAFNEYMHPAASAQIPAAPVQVAQASEQQPQPASGGNRSGAAMAAYRFLEQNLNGNSDLNSWVSSSLEGEFKAVNGDICLISVREKWAFLAEYRYRIRFSALDVNSPRIVGDGVEEAQKVAIAATGGQEFSVSGKDDDDKWTPWQPIKSATLMITGGNRPEILRAFVVLAHDCGAPDGF